MRCPQRFEKIGVLGVDIVTRRDNNYLNETNNALEGKTMKTIELANAKHAYELGTEQGKVTVYANTRAQARKAAEREGYTVRDVNMIG